MDTRLFLHAAELADDDRHDVCCDACGKRLTHLQIRRRRVTAGPSVRPFCSRKCHKGTQASEAREQRVDRFWSKVEKTDSCWLWIGMRWTNGYGRFPNGGGQEMRAHRFAWEVTYGPIPLGLFACHRCDVKLCVRPEHLFLGTHADNMADMVAKDRHCAGDRNGRAKLTAAQVNEIRRLSAAGVPISQLSEQFPVSAWALADVVHGRNWKVRDA